MNALKLSVFALATMLAAPALASHTDTHSTGWFEYQWNAADTAVLYCNALGAIPVGAGGLALHDRKGVEQINGLTDTDGGGTWMFQESNLIAGIQIGGAGAIPDVPDPTGEYPYIVTFADPYGPADPATGHPGCPNGDTVVF